MMVIQSRTNPDTIIPGLIDSHLKYKIVDMLPPRIKEIDRQKKECEEA